MRSLRVICTQSTTAGNARIGGAELGASMTRAELLDVASHGRSGATSPTRARRRTRRHRGDLVHVLEGVETELKRVQGEGLDGRAEEHSGEVAENASQESRGTQEGVRTPTVLCGGQGWEFCYNIYSKTPTPAHRCSCGFARFVLSRSRQMQRI